MSIRDEVVNSIKNKKSFELTIDKIPYNCKYIIGCFDIPVTSRCTLNCKDCSSLMPYYEQQQDFAMDEIIGSVIGFLDLIDYVIRINVLGGEPFLHPELHRLLKVLNASSKVEKVRVITNGTVIPSNSEVFKELRAPKMQVRISHYELGKLHIEGFIRRLESENANYTLKEFGPNEFQWYDYGGFNKRNRSKLELDEQKAHCDVEWYCLLDGKLYPCPRAAHATDIGLIPDDSDNYFCWNKKTKEDNQKNLLSFILRSKGFPACDYCDRGTNLCNTVKVAEQK